MPVATPLIQSHRPPSTMSCLCHKLSEREYSKVDATEVNKPPLLLEYTNTSFLKAEILKRSWEEASYLFEVDPTPKRKKRPASSTASRVRKLSRKSSYSNLLIKDCSSQTTLQGQGPPLEASYVACGLVKTDDSPLKQHAERGTITTNVFLAIDTIDEKVGVGKLLRRVYCCVFAELHMKGTSVEKIIKDIHNVTVASNKTRDKVYRFLHIGTKWGEIIQLFADITKEDKNRVLGLLNLLKSSSV